MLPTPTPRACKVVGPNPQRMPMPSHRQRQHRPIQTRHLNVRFARIPPEEWRQLCELDEDQFEAGMERWTQVLSGATEGDLNHLSAVIPRGLLVGNTARWAEVEMRILCWSTGCQPGSWYLWLRYSSTLMTTACTLMILRSLIG